VRTFNIEINNKKSKEIKIFSTYTKNITETIDLILVDIRVRDLNLAVWQNEEMTYSEIVTLDNQFEEEEFITIKEKKGD
jgi:maltose-binding protein MalE